ncbi:MAG: MtrB/PioB family outer membrane beta-barrel protein [Acidobacteria bacterium]|nr:MtrB/PioB family outer membrane beta-barrel protein [Acidobacteriota bacterium]
MRNRLVLLTAALLLASRPGWAQAPQAPAAAPVPTSLLSGTVDVGGLFTTTDGDAARFERYRDTRNGLYSTFGLNRTTGTYLFNADAFHVGYRDQRYDAAFMSRRINVDFDWVSVPLNFSYLTRTPYVTNGSTLTLPDSAQAAVQNRTAVGVPCAPGAAPAACGTPAQAALAKTNRSIYNSVANPFDLRYRRDITGVALNYAATRAVDLDARFTSSKRAGQQPWGASFAFNDAVELPQPLDQRTNDASLAATWANPRRMFRLGWDGSWFNNAIHSLTWDNPIRLTDFTNGLAPPTGPFDPSGYSNGNGPAQGRQAMAPSNAMNVVSATGLYKMRGRTTVNGVAQLTEQRQNESLIPWTTNAVINSPIVLAAFPHLAQLPRATADAKAQGVNTLINLSSRPFRAASFTVRYRYNDRDVQTPAFDAREYVRFDAVPEEIEEGISQQYDTSRHIFDANVALTPVSWGTFRVGYGHEAVERHGRGFSDVGEDILRLSFDTFTSQYVTLRASFDTARRRGTGFVEAGTGRDEEEALLGPGGTQPTLRYFDEADRDRTRASVILTVMPRDNMDVYTQFGGGRDRYRADNSFPVSRPGELFGLHESDVASWNAGFNVHPADVVALGANYGRDRYSSLQLSRNASPPPDPSWNDPARNWTLDNDDHINTLTAYLDLLRAVRNTDIRFSYDYSDSSNSFAHGGPRIAALASLNQFIPLPNVENTWHRAIADVQYFFNPKTGVGFGYYFEKLDIVDFNTIDTNGPVGFAPETGDPRIDWLGGLVTGYGNRPYTGHSVFARVLYRF